MTRLKPGRLACLVTLLLTACSYVSSQQMPYCTFQIFMDVSDCYSTYSDDYNDAVSDLTAISQICSTVEGLIRELDTCIEPLAVNCPAVTSDSIMRELDSFRHNVTGFCEGGGRCISNPCVNGGNCTEPYPGTFQCLCPAGFTGEYCEMETSGSNSTSCWPNPCANRGSCKYYSDMDIYCNCMPGFTGEWCETDLHWTPDQGEGACESNPCLYGEQCVPFGYDWNPKYYCNCTNGHSGYNCEYESMNATEGACWSSPCQHWGSCFDDWGDSDWYECECMDGYTGHNCEHSMNTTTGAGCASNPCQNWISCTDLIYPNGYQCMCMDGYSGQNCEIEMNVTRGGCSSDPCQNRGSCHDYGNPYWYECRCVDGYTGHNCETRNQSVGACSSNPCQNGGYCDYYEDSYWYNCVCPHLFTGSNCESDMRNSSCRPNPCQNGGSCRYYSSGFTYCDCPPGITGEQCETDLLWVGPGRGACESNPCQYGGSCVPFGYVWNPSYYCNCTINGHPGYNCERESNQSAGACGSSPCQNWGTCHDYGDPYWYQCMCADGYSGVNCESGPNATGSCWPNPCQNNGECSYYDGNSLYCNCRPGYTGFSCETDLHWSPDRGPGACHSNPCQGGGKCIPFGIDPDWNYYCNCSYGRSGYNCENTRGFSENTCLSDPCLNGGICLHNSTGPKCVCAPGYADRNCYVQNSRSRPYTCSLQRIEREVTSCLNDSEVTIKAAFANETELEQVCVSIENYTDALVMCVNRTFYQTTCSYDVKERYFDQLDYYNQQFYRLHAQCKSRNLTYTACSSQPCMNGGTCEDYGEQNWYQCYCPDSHSGHDCESKTYSSGACSSNVCYNGGTCVDYGDDNWYQCYCADGFTGSDCWTKIDACQSYPCQNYGSCTDYGGYYKCDCQAGFSGQNCEYGYGAGACQSRPCQNYGACTDYGGYYKCDCQAGFSGEHCEYGYDDGACRFSPCRNGGSCQDYGDSYGCTCTDNFFGPNCDMHISATMCKSYPCLNNGSCQPSNTGDSYSCYCGLGFSGENCENLYEGPCRSSPCNGNATCNQYGRGFQDYWCDCGYGAVYKNEMCSVYDSVCAQQPCMHGASCSEGACQCTDGYHGIRCELGPHNEPPYNACDNNPCLGSGICLRNGTGFQCACDEYLTGPQCEFFASFPTPMPCYKPEVSKRVSECLNHTAIMLQNAESSIVLMSKFCENTAVAYSGALQHCYRNVLKLYSCDDQEKYEYDQKIYALGDKLEPLSRQCPNLTRIGCDTNPCEQGGICRPSSTAHGYMCECLFGWTGPNCSEYTSETPCRYNPCRHNGECVPYMAAGVGYFCRCMSDYTGYDCETSLLNKTSSCYGQTCYNGGSCSKSASGLYECTCPYPYIGGLCETHPGEVSCRSGPCRNGGSCLPTVYAPPPDLFHCNCHEGYSGYRCENSLHNATRSCREWPCHNGGSCEMSASGLYECFCRFPYIGVQCETDKGELACRSNPCYNGGSCIRTPYTTEGYYCDCQNGYNGMKCENYYGGPGSCQYNMCQNGGSCTSYSNNDADVWCECRQGYWGAYCEESFPACMNAPCLNGGSCTQGFIGDARCHCPFGYEGLRCEYMSDGSLAGDMCESHPCMFGGLCIAENHNYRCQCPPGRDGYNCRYRMDPPYHKYHCNETSIRGNISQCVERVKAALNASETSAVALSQICMHVDDFVPSLGMCIDRAFWETDCDEHYVAAWESIPNEYQYKFVDVAQKCRALKKPECRNIENDMMQCMMDVQTKYEFDNMDSDNTTFFKMCQSASVWMDCVVNGTRKCPELREMYISNATELLQLQTPLGCNFDFDGKIIKPEGCNVLEATKCINLLLMSENYRPVTENTSYSLIWEYISMLDYQNGICYMIDVSVIESVMACVEEHMETCEDIFGSEYDGGSDHDDRQDDDWDWGDDDDHHDVTTISPSASSDGHWDWGDNNHDSQWEGDDARMVTPTYSEGDRPHPPASRAGGVSSQGNHSSSGGSSSSSGGSSYSSGSSSSSGGRNSSWSNSTSSGGNSSWSNSTSSGGGSSWSNSSSEMHYSGVPDIMYLYRKLGELRKVCDPACPDLEQMEWKFELMENCTEMHSGIDRVMNNISRQFTHGQNYREDCQNLIDIAQCAERVSGGCGILEDDIAQEYIEKPRLWQMQGICDYKINVDIKNPRGQCPKKEDVMHKIDRCRNYGRQILTKEYLPSSDACKLIQREINCISNVTRGCVDLIREFIEPSLYDWTMTVDALGCSIYDVDVNLQGVSLLFMNSDECSFYELSKCYETVFDRMEIRPDRPGYPVPITYLNRWLNVTSGLYFEQKQYCSYFEGYPDYAAMARCADDVKHQCMYKVPLIAGLRDYSRDNNTPKPPKPENPFDMEKPGKLATDICHSKCHNLPRRGEAINDCSNVSTTRTAWGLEGLAKEIMRNREQGNTNLHTCKSMKNVSNCLHMEVDRCPYLIDSVERKFEEDDMLSDALWACGMTLDLSGAPPSTEPPDLAQSGVVHTSIVSVLLAALLILLQ